jgi:hypothetical protein
MSQPELKRIREGLSNFLNPSEFIYGTLIADANFEENRCLSSKPKVKASNEDESMVKGMTAKILWGRITILLV